jgi:hypothetical protein
MSRGLGSTYAGRREPFGLLAALLVGSCAVRLAAANNALWCDEVVSIVHAAELRRAWDVLQLHHDNNHPLNTLVLRFVPSGGGALSQRIVSVVASCLTVFVAARVGWRHAELLGADRRRACWAAVTGAAAMGACYPIVLFGTEARGYGLAMFFAAAGLLTVVEFEHAAAPPRGARARKMGAASRAGWLAIVGWNLVVPLALTAHVTAISFLLAGGVWSIVFAREHFETTRQRLGFLAAWNLVPGLATVGFYLAFASQIEVAGGPRWSYASVLGELAGLATGVPHHLGLAIGVPALIACLLGGLAPHLGRGAGASERPARTPLAAFFAVGVVLAPTTLLSIQPPAYLHGRYFLLPLSLLVLLLPAVLPGRNTPRQLRWGFCLLAGFALAGNGLELAELLRRGRGEYLPCLEEISTDAKTRETALVVGINSQFRIGSVARYYLGRTGSLTRIRLVPIDRRDQPFDWIIVDPSSLLYHAPEVSPGDGLHRFELARDCPAARGAGVPWRTFRRATQ